MPITSNITEGIAEVVIDHPPVNAPDVAGWFGLADAITEAGRNPEVRCVVLRAEGRGFCAGVDIKGNGSCATDADTSSLPTSLLKNITFEGGGSGDITTCEAFVASGFYLAGFSPSPAPPASAGSFTIGGSVPSVALVLIGSSGPIFVAEGDLVLDPLVSANVSQTQACLGIGTTKLRYVGVLTFADP